MIIIDFRTKTKRKIRSNSVDLFLLVFLISLIIFYDISCNSNKSELAKDILIKRVSKPFIQWQDFFEDEGTVSFKLGKIGKELYTIASINLNEKGDYLVLDGKAQQVYLFDKYGDLIKPIGRQGEGPGEYRMVSNPIFDKKGNIYVYDIQSYCLVRYSKPNYEYDASFKVNKSIQNIVFTDDNHFIAYSISDEFILYKFSLDMSDMKRTFLVEDRNFRAFSARFQLGRLSLIPDKGILVSYPEKYKIYLYDNELNIKKIFYPKEFSVFIPQDAHYPKDLSPYDFTKKHAKCVFSN